jgi:hypothetical protein
MRKLFITIVMLLTASVAMSGSPDNPKMDLETSTYTPRVFVGFSEGFNYGGIIALTVENKLIHHLSLFTSMGYSYWGLKLGAEFRYYKNFPEGIYFAGGFSRNLGLPSWGEELNTTNGRQYVTVKYTPVNTINCGVGYAYRLTRHLRINVETGYAIKISTGDGYIVISDHILTNNREFIPLFKPGGLRLGFGMNLGF